MRIVMLLILVTTVARQFPAHANLYFDGQGIITGCTIDIKDYHSQISTNCNTRVTKCYKFVPQFCHVFLGEPFVTNLYYTFKYNNVDLSHVTNLRVYCL